MHRKAKGQPSESGGSSHVWGRCREAHNVPGKAKNREEARTEECRWEIRVGLDPRDGPDGSLDLDGDGYTNPEEFLDETQT